MAGPYDNRMASDTPVTFAISGSTALDNAVVRKVAYGEQMYTKNDITSITDTAKQSAVGGRKELGDTTVTILYDPDMAIPLGTEVTITVTFPTPPSGYSSGTVYALTVTPYQQGEVSIGDDGEMELELTCFTNAVVVTAAVAA